MQDIFKCALALQTPLKLRHQQIFSVTFLQAQHLIARNSTVES